MKTLLLAALLWLTTPALAASPNPQVEMKTSMGTIVIELYPENAPKTVENFIQYAKDGFYNGTLFHRVIPGFMIQGGGFTRTFEEKTTRAPIRNEAGNGLRNATGMLAMARTPDPHSATAQFFINLVDNPMLDFRSATPDGYGYCVFGKVVKGMDVVNRIAKVATGPGKPPHRDVPLQPVLIERAAIINEASSPTGK